MFHIYIYILCVKNLLQKKSIMVRIGQQQIPIWRLIELQHQTPKKGGIFIFITLSQMHGKVVFHIALINAL